MNRSELSTEDQNLLGTVFPAELEKEAASEVAIFAEMYDTGFEKIAVQIADSMEAAAQAAAAEVTLSKEAEARAQELATPTERGTFDGLRKLGQERYGDEWFYIHPLVMEKEADMRERAGKAWEAVKAAPGKAWGGVKAAPGKFTEYHKGIGRGMSAGFSGVNEYGQKLNKMERAKSIGIAGAKLVPHAAAAGSAAAYAKHRMDKKKEEQEGE